MKTSGEAIRVLVEKFRQAGLDNPRLDARVLVAAVLATTPTQVFTHPQTELSEDHQKQIQAFAERRLDHEPVARILGVREFWSLNFRVDASTLVPRPDSETLVEAVLDRIVDHTAPVSILDMGTGSGCLVLALLSELPSARGLGIDWNGQAVGIARENAQALKLAQRARFEQSHWFDDLAPDRDGPFDVIISNPPYISNREMAALERDVAAFDPELALSGGEDGLQAYRELLPPMAQNLADGGFIALEIGFTQALSVQQIGEQAGLVMEAVIQDLAGRDRVLVFGAAATG